jgi:hypothetical protein
VNQINTHVFLHSLAPSALKLSAKNRVDDVALFQSQLNQYAERALLLAESKDYMILNHYPDKDYLDYLIDMDIGTRKILIPKNQGLSLSENVLGDEQLLKRLKTLGTQIVLHPYISTEIEEKIAKVIDATVNGSPPDLTAKVNSKIYIPTLLQALALPIPEYEIANTVTVINTAKKFINQYDKIIVIGNHTYGGIAVWAITNEKTFNTFKLDISQSPPDEKFLVEKMYNVVCSPNIQFQIYPDAIETLGITEQILDDKLDYHGNKYPLSTKQLDKIRQDSFRICEKLSNEGYRGLLGIDFIETIDGKIFAVDINGRANTSSFGLKVIRKLFPDSYFKKNFKILSHINIEKKATFVELIDILGKENVFDKQVGRGIFPYNTGFLQWGKFSAIVIANTWEEVNQLLACIAVKKPSRLSVPLLRCQNLEG